LVAGLRFEAVADGVIVVLLAFLGQIWTSEDPQLRSMPGELTGSLTWYGAGLACGVTCAACAYLI
jgi:hypothetical protein